MKQILILGNSIAGVKAIEKIRSVDRESPITLFLLENCLPYNPQMFADYIAKKIELKNVLCEPEQFYQNENIQVIANQTISRINLKRKQLFTEQKESFAFDTLVITDIYDQKTRDIKGAHKQGVYNLTNFDTAAQVLENLPFVETVVIQFNDFESFKLASAFRRRSKEVILLVPEGILEQIFDQKALELLQGALDSIGVRVVPGATIQEILGDNDAKAVKLDSGKVFSAEMVVFTEACPDLRLFKDSPLALQDRICVDEKFRTGVEGVFAVGRICQRTQDKALAREYTLGEISLQGMCVGAEIIGEECLYAPPLYQIEQSIGDFSIDAIGDLRHQDGQEKIVSLDEERKTYKSLRTKDGHVVGAVLLNAPEDKAKLFLYVEQKANTENLGPLGNLLSTRDVPETTDISNAQEDGRPQEPDIVQTEATDPAPDEQTQKDLSDSCEKLNNLQL